MIQYLFDSVFNYFHYTMMTLQKSPQRSGDETMQEVEKQLPMLRLSVKLKIDPFSSAMMDDATVILTPCTLSYWNCLWETNIMWETDCQTVSKSLYGGTSQELPAPSFACHCGDIRHSLCLILYPNLGTKSCFDQSHGTPLPYRARAHTPVSEQQAKH